MKFIMYDTGGQYEYDYDPKNPPEWISRYGGGTHIHSPQPTHDLEPIEEIKFSELETVSE